MRPAEESLLVAVLDKPERVSVRDVISWRGVPEKRCWYYLTKWTSKDWYEYGVCLDLGWLTEAGIEAARALKRGR